MKTTIKKKDIYKIKNNFIILFVILFIESNIYKEKTINHFPPKISIFLPIYNKAKYLKRSIKSIQIQTLKNIEIIPVNDCSEDNSLEVLKKMAKSDSRIKIVNNDRNRGLLYSRAMGILIYCKGKYIMNLDPDDELSSPNNLKYLYNKINKLKVDVLSFGLINYLNINMKIIVYTKKARYLYIIKRNGLISTKLFLCSNFNNIQLQPEIFNHNSEIFDFLISNKLIKNKLFKQVCKKFKNKISGEKWNYGEDEIWSILINNFANSKMCIKKGIYIYNINNYSLSSNTINYLYTKNIINWIETLKNFLMHKNEKIYLNRFNDFININEGNKQFLANIRNNKEIKYKYFNIFRNLTFQINIKNSTSKDIIDLLKSIIYKSK